MFSETTRSLNCNKMVLGNDFIPPTGSTIDISSSDPSNVQISINGSVPGGGGGGGDVTQIGNNVFTGTNKFDNMNGIVVANDILFEDKLTALTPGVPEFKILFNDGVEGLFNTGINCCFIAKEGQEDDFGLATDCIKYEGASGAGALFLIWNEATGLITAVDKPSGGGGIPVGTALLLAPSLSLQTVQSPVFFNDTGGIQIRNKIELISGVNPGTAKIEIDHRFFPTSNIPIHHLAVVPSTETSAPAEAYINTLFRNSKLLVPLGSLPPPASAAVTGEPMNKVLGWNDTTGEVTFSEELEFSVIDTVSTINESTILDNNDLRCTRSASTPFQSLNTCTYGSSGLNIQASIDPGTGPITSTCFVSSSGLTFNGSVNPTWNVRGNNVLDEYFRSVTEYRAQASFTVTTGLGQTSTTNNLFNFNTTLFKTYINGTDSGVPAATLNSAGMGAGTLAERIYNMTLTFVTDIEGSEGYMPTGSGVNRDGYQNLKCYTGGINDGNGVPTSIIQPVSCEVDGVKWLSDNSIIRISGTNQAILFPTIVRVHNSLPSNDSTYRIQMPTAGTSPVFVGGTTVCNISLTIDTKKYKYGGFLS